MIVEARLTDVARPTRQQIFDAVTEHAAQMPEQCLAGIEGKCAYRSNDGKNACFVGCLLTDTEAAALDTRGAAGIGNLLNNHPEVVPERLRSQDLRYLLLSLQRIHDRDAQSGWPNSLRDLAKEHRLDASIVERAFT